MQSSFAVAKFSFMSKKHILFLLAGLCFLTLHFVSAEKAEELVGADMPEGFQEQFYKEYLYPSFSSSKEKDPVKTLSNQFYKRMQSASYTQGLEREPRELVTATIYKPTHPMTDITASGRKIDTLHASSHRWIAVSRDLQQKGFDFGTQVLISGTGSHDGIWEVQDVMNRRWQQRIDFLSDLDAPDNYWENVMITKLN